MYARVTHELSTFPLNVICKAKTTQMYVYHKANTQALKEDLFKWSNNFATKDMSTKTVDEMYTEFQTALNSAMNTHIPTKIITKRNQTPWINRRIKRL